MLLHERVLRDRDIVNKAAWRLARVMILVCFLLLSVIHPVPPFVVAPLRQLVRGELEQGVVERGILFIKYCVKTYLIAVPCLYRLVHFCDSLLAMHYATINCSQTREIGNEVILLTK